MNETTNPRKGDIETMWESVVGMISTGDSSGVAMTMDGLLKNDLPLWNAIYWRIDSWFASYFAREPMTESDERSGLTRIEVGRIRFIDWLWRTQDGRSNWTTSDLKRIISTLPKQSKEHKPHWND